MNPLRLIDHSTKWAWDHRWKILNWIRDRYNELGRVLDNTRASVVIVAAGALVFFFTEQGGDITVGIGDLNGWNKLLFVLAIALWAFAGWYWARLILDMKKVRDEEGPFLKWLASHVPRFLGVSAFGFAAAALFRTAAFSWLFFLTAVLGLLFYLFVLYRTKMKFLGRMSASPFKQVNSVWLWLGFLVNVSLLAWALISPVTLGNFLGSGTLIFIVFFSWLHLAGWAVYLTHSKGFPILKLALALALLFSLWNDNHEIRSLSAIKSVPGKKPEEPVRVAVKDFFAAWNENNGRTEEKPPLETGRPLIVVATAGGGLRAAYWTATVLGAAADQAQGAFIDNLFAMSGVSGGSLGATVFNTVLLRPRQWKCGEDNGRKSKGNTCIEGLGQRVLERDFLAPSLASLGYPDLLQRFLPVGFLPDRAAALEEAWSAAWRGVFPIAPNLMEASFLSLWKNTGSIKSWPPALLLNGTHQQTGKRMITSNLKIDGRNVNGPIFPDALDFFTVFGCHIRTSTAALNSARFTYVSPAGTLRCENQNQGNLLDGGYFENFGAITARDLLQALKTRPDFRGRAIRPVVIQISSDPTLPLNVLTKSPAADPAERTWANETLAPVRTLMKTREGRGILAAKKLRQWVTTFNNGKTRGRAKFFHFRLLKGGPVTPPLGWVLSTAARKEIRDQLTHPINACPFGRLMEALKAPVPEFVARQECCMDCEASK